MAAWRIAEPEVQAIEQGAALADTVERFLRRTPFDDIDSEVPAEARRNRLLLLGLMRAAGWDFSSREWWHCQLFNARARYPVLADSVLPQGLMHA